MDGHNSHVSPESPLNLSAVNAMVWATRFSELYPEPGVETMLGWFANSIEKGRSAGRAEAEAEAESAARSAS